MNTVTNDVAIETIRRCDHRHVAGNGGVIFKIKTDKPLEYSLLAYDGPGKCRIVAARQEPGVRGARRFREREPSCLSPEFVHHDGSEANVRRKLTRDACVRESGAVEERLRQRRRTQPMAMELEDRRLFSTFTVTNIADSGPGSLRYEIGLATSDNTNDTIRFSSLFNNHQTITLTSGQLVLSKTTGTLTIEGPGANLLSVSGNHASRVFYMNGGSAYLSGLTVSQGSAYSGGGLYNNGGTITLTDCTVSGNSASGNGGGLYDFIGMTTLINDSFSGNSASVSGGGMFDFFGTSTLTSSTFSGNSSSVDGGGLYGNASTATLTNCTVTGNYASVNGGGLYNYWGSSYLYYGTLSGNSAGNKGGGAETLGGTTTLTNVSVSGNSAGTGGGLYNSNGTTTLSNVLVSANLANNGGGLSTFGGTTTLTNSYRQRQLRHPEWRRCRIPSTAARLRSPIVPSAATLPPERRRPEHRVQRHDHAHQLYRQRQLCRRERRRPEHRVRQQDHARQLRVSGIRLRQWRGLDTEYDSATALANCTVSGNSAIGNGGAWTRPGGTTTRRGHGQRNFAGCSAAAFDGNATLTLGNTIVAENTATIGGPMHSAPLSHWATT